MVQIHVLLTCRIACHVMPWAINKPLYCRQILRCRCKLGRFQSFHTTHRCFSIISHADSIALCRKNRHQQLWHLGHLKYHCAGSRGWPPTVSPMMMKTQLRLTRTHWVRHLDASIQPRMPMTLCPTRIRHRTSLTEMRSTTGNMMKIYSVKSCDKWPPLCTVMRMRLRRLVQPKFHMITWLCFVINSLLVSLQNIYHSTSFNITLVGH